MLEIRADPWIFLAFVPFGSGVLIVFSLNPAAFSGSLWQCLGLLRLRCVQRVKPLSEKIRATSANGVCCRRVLKLPAVRGAC